MDDHERRIEAAAKAMAGGVGLWASLTEQQRKTLREKARAAIAAFCKDAPRVNLPYGKSGGKYMIDFWEEEVPKGRYVLLPAAPGEASDPCRSCKWLNLPHEGGYCYMFREMPRKLPCGQFKKEADDA